MDYILPGTHIHQHLVWNKLVKVKTFSYNYGMKSVSLKSKEFQASANRKGEVKVYSTTSECGPDLSPDLGDIFPHKKLLPPLWRLIQGPAETKVSEV